MKRFYVALAALGMLFATSCTTEQTSVVEMEEDFVTISLGVENVLGSRAISDGTSVDQLMYAFFDEEGTLVLKKAVKDDVLGLTAEGGYTLRISLAKGQTYQGVFWAQSGSSNAYAVSDDMKVTVNYEGTNNDELRDAFFGKTEKFTVGSATSVSVVLKRPFAQVNVGAFPYDYEYAKSLGIEITKSSATIKGVANTINLFDGTVEGSVDVTYTEAARPTEILAVDVDDNGQYEDYEYLSMSYLLAGTESSAHEMTFAFTDNEGTVIELNQGVSFVPIQRNWRTNIVGQILTGEIYVNVKVDPAYDGETIQAGGLYYNFSGVTEIKDKEFAFNSTDVEAIFSSATNESMTLENVTFSGTIWQIAIGDYLDGGSITGVQFENHLKNVRAENLVVGNAVSNVGLIDYMSVAIFLRGKITIDDCVFKGATTVAAPSVYKGVEYPYLPYDCGVPNYCEAQFNNCDIDRIYVWSHSLAHIKNSKIGYITCSTHNKSYDIANLTIGEGAEVDTIRVTASTANRKLWSPSLRIEAGAKVGILDMNNRPEDDVYIDPAAEVGEIINRVTTGE